MPFKVQKFKDFPKILREINFDKFRLQESNILAILEALNINFGDIFAFFFQAEIFKNLSEPLKL